MNILVSGASGFFGRNFIKLATKKGHYIYGISRHKQKRLKNVKWIVGGLDKYHKHFKKCKVLVHFASAGVANRNLSYKKAFEIGQSKVAYDRLYDLYLNKFKDVKKAAFLKQQYTN